MIAAVTPLGRYGPALRPRLKSNVFGSPTGANRLTGDNRRLHSKRGLAARFWCLQSREGKTLNAFAGVANTENQEISALSIVPKFSRTSRH